MGPAMYQDYWAICSQKLCTTFGCIAQLSVEFKLLSFISDFRSMTKHDNSIKLNLSLHNTKVALSLIPY